MMYLLGFDNFLLGGGFLLFFRTGRRRLFRLFFGQIGETSGNSAVGPGSGILIVFALAHIPAHKNYNGDL